MPIGNEVTGTRVDEVGDGIVGAVRDAIARIALYELDHTAFGA